MLNEEFISIIKAIITTEEFQSLKTYRHHIKGTVYTHSIKVAYLCYKHHKRHNLKSDIRELVIGALLHDFYLYDHNDKCERLPYHWFRHPRLALENAAKKYPSLTDIQRDMISRHMFPLTPIPPKTLSGWLVCFYDKVAAVSDRFGKNDIEFRELFEAVSC